ncbi:MAG: vitamin K epoxide reductase family protein [Acidimicrobiia bacterium]|nr:vitamin K epoxide reductase family protein [Acidimicrobiia bacterium]
MSKKAKTRSNSSTTVAMRTAPNWPLLVLSLAGVALSGYLTWTSLSGGDVAGCEVGGGCDVVLSSRWARLLGLPTAAWGLLAYATLAAIAFVRRVDRHWSYSFTVAFFGTCFSVYLTVVSLTILQSTCPYCLTSLGLMSATLALVVLQRPVQKAQRSWLWVTAGRGVIAALVILMVHAVNAAPQAEPIGPEDPAIRALAEHLSDQRVVFYGASWCSHCQDQKRLFGASASRLPYIECSPNGPNGQQLRSCSAAGVRSYPTWVIKGQTYVGVVLTLAQLAEATGFPGAASFK